MIVFPEQSKGFDEQCAFIWFPRKGHGELEIKSKIHNLFCGENEVQEESEPDRRARALAGFAAPYFRFQIGISAQEKERIIEELGHLGMQTCSGNVAAVLRKVTGMALPRIDSMFPSKLAKHLYQTREAPDSRVCKIEYFGELPSVSDVDKLWDQSLYESRIAEYIMVAVLVYYIIMRFVELGNRLQSFGRDQE